MAAFGVEERTVTAWWARSGRQGQAVQEHLVAQSRDLGQGQAEEIRVKQPGGIGWMALAMMVKTRLGLGGEVSAPRDRSLMRGLMERGKRWAARRPLLGCPDGVVSSMRAMRETLRDALPTGVGGRPRLRRWRHGVIAHILKRSERWRVVRARRHAWRCSDGVHRATVSSLRPTSSD